MAAHPSCSVHLKRFNHDGKKSKLPEVETDVRLAGEAASRPFLRRMAMESGERHRQNLANQSFPPNSGSKHDKRLWWRPHVEGTFFLFCSSLLIHPPPALHFNGLRGHPCGTDYRVEGSRFDHLQISSTISQSGELSRSTHTHRHTALWLFFLSTFFLRRFSSCLLTQLEMLVLKFFLLFCLLFLWSYWLI